MPTIANSSTDQESGAPVERALNVRSLLLRGFLVVAVLGGITFGTKAWLHAQSWVSTDDAYLQAHVEQVSSRVAGRVDEVLVQDNELVQAGQPLVKLDDGDQQVAIKQKEASLASAQAGVAKAEAQRAAAIAGAAQVAAQWESAKATSINSEQQLSRTKKLVETGAATQQSLDEANKNSISDQAAVTAGEKQITSFAAGVQYTDASLEAAKAAVAEAEADLAKAKLELTYTLITAKQAGRVTVKSVEPGNYVQPGQALMAVVSTEVWVEANYKETQLSEVRAGQEAIVRVDAFPDLELRGHLESIQGGSGAQFSLLPPENATGNFVKVVQRVPVKIVLDAPPVSGPILGPGMSVVPEIRVRN